MADTGLCRCGCGNRTKIAARTSARCGWVKGKPLLYLRGHAAWKDNGPKWTVNENGCWIWQRALNNQGYAMGGFARLGYGPGTQLAHRVLYIEKFGPIPGDLPLDHTCHTRDKTCPGGMACWHRACVRPEHGEPVSDLENSHRAVSTKASEADMAVVYDLRREGVSWRDIAPRFGMTHPPLVTRLRKYCERNGLAWP